MSDKSSIEWCDSTFNPWIGCTKVGPGCDHCYAEADFDLRRHRAKWGPGNPRSRTSPANWKKPLQWNAKPFYECGCGYRGTIDELTTNAIHRCGEQFKRVRRRVFCASLTDVFDNEVPAEWRRDLFALIATTPNIDWLLLTKRIGNAAGMIEAAIGDEYNGYGWPWKNVWLGATVVNQEEADRDIPKLLAIPAHIHFLSMEPLLGPADIGRHLQPYCDHGSRPHLDGGGITCQRCMGSGECAGIDWVIVGGESGTHSRIMAPDWARSLRDQCDTANVPYLFKQWGEWAPAVGNAGYGDNLVAHVGKKLAGRLLDGKLHDGYPEARP